jgi:hypothetical protein
LGQQQHHQFLWWTVEGNICIRELKRNIYERILCIDTRNLVGNNISESKYGIGKSKEGECCKWVWSPVFASAGQRKLWLLSRKEVQRGLLSIWRDREDLRL